MPQNRIEQQTIEDRDYSDQSLEQAEYAGCTFKNCNLTNADLSGSVHYSINPEINKIRGAKFSLPDVTGLLDIYKIRIE